MEAALVKRLALALSQLLAELLKIWVVGTRHVFKRINNIVMHKLIGLNPDTAPPVALGQ